MTTSNFALSRLRSVELVVPDLGAAVDFYTSVWGLVDVEREGTTAWLRAGGGDPYILRLTAGRAAAVTAITFRAAPDLDLRALRTRLLDVGATANEDIAHVHEPGGGSAFSVRDRAGRCIRIVQGDAVVSVLEHGGSRPGRLAHVNINTTDMAQDVRFFEAGLGFRLTDRSAAMSFLCTNDDHHAVVLAEAPVDTLNHIAFGHDAWEDVMKASGRMCDAGFPIGWGPGRHGPGNNVFMYFVDPFGIVIEHTAEVMKVDESYRVGGPDKWRWPQGRVDQWGIAPPKTDDCKAAQLAIPFM